MNDTTPNSYRTGPDERGRFGDFGGRFVSETLMPLILDLEAEYEKAKTDAAFWAEMEDLWKHYVGRPSPLYFAERGSCWYFSNRLHPLEVALSSTDPDRIAWTSI